MDAMEEAVRQRLAEAGHSDVTIERRLSPAWTTDWMSSDSAQRVARVWHRAAGCDRVARNAVPRARHADLRVRIHGVQGPVSMRGVR